MHPRGPGPWASEPDKISWIDPATGLPCILRRGKDGALRGHVGVGPQHPYFGVEPDALPHDPAISVHGGIDYAWACEENERSDRSVCHVPVPRVHVPGYSRDPVRMPGADQPLAEALELPAELWWFGFSCAHTYDWVPARDGWSRRDPLTTENGLVYRDEAYVVRETTDLAVQLHAVAHGLPMPEPRADRPPVGLDPYDPGGVL